MRLLESLSWLLLALVHLLPAAAFFVPALITRLYGAAPAEPAFLLLQHRAALFLCIVAACLWAAFSAGPRPLAALITAISMLSFLFLWFAAGRPAPLRTIAVADLIALPALAFVTLRILITARPVP